MGSHAELVGRMYAAFAIGDIEALAAGVAPDVTEVRFFIDSRTMLEVLGR